jgi:hypothetical protein
MYKHYGYPHANHARKGELTVHFYYFEVDGDCYAFFTRPLKRATGPKRAKPEGNPSLQPSSNESAPSQAGELLGTKGTVYAFGSDAACQLEVLGSIIHHGTCSFSDERLKEKIADACYGLNEVLQLRPRRFVWRKSQKPDEGFIAQELERVFPHLVSTASSGYQVVNTAGLLPVLVKSIQELAEQDGPDREALQSIAARLSRLEATRSCLVYRPPSPRVRAAMLTASVVALWLAFYAGITVLTAVPIVHSLGFTHTGIRPYSFAARYMASYLGHVPRGSLCARLQTIGA